MLKMHPSWYVFLSLSSFSLLAIGSSSNWFIIWIFFELSMISFMPLIQSSSIEMMTKYYNIQTVGSYIFVLSYFLNDFKQMFYISMSIKLGLIPFIFWLPLVMSKMSWMACYLLNTLQKAGPLLVVLCAEKSMLFFSLCSFSIFFSSLLGLNQMELRKMMAFSSTSYSAFILLLSYFNYCFSLFFFLLYTLVLFFMSYNWAKKSISKLTHLAKESSLMRLALLFLTGMPPSFFFF